MQNLRQRKSKRKISTIETVIPYSNEKQLFELEEPTYAFMVEDIENNYNELEENDNGYMSEEMMYDFEDNHSASDEENFLEEVNVDDEEIDYSSAHYEFSNINDLFKQINEETIVGLYNLYFIL